MVLDVPAQPDSVALVRHALRGALEASGVPPSAVCDVLLAVSEACTNAIVHAGSSSPRLETGLEWTEDRITVRVRDFGAGFALRPDSPGLGLGLSVIAAVTDSVEIHSLDPGTEVVMTFAVSPSTAGQPVSG